MWFFESAKCKINSLDYRIVAGITLSYEMLIEEVEFTEINKQEKLSPCCFEICQETRIEVL